MKIPKGYKVKMVFYDDKKVSWETFEGIKLIDFGLSDSEKKAEKIIKNIFKSIKKHHMSWKIKDFRTITTSDKCRYGKHKEGRCTHARNSFNGLSVLIHGRYGKCTKQRCPLKIK